jgi:hypothetical protein
MSSISKKLLGLTNPFVEVLNLSSFEYLTAEVAFEFKIILRELSGDNSLTLSSHC